MELVCGKHTSVKTAQILTVKQEGFLFAWWNLFERGSGFCAFAILVTLTHGEECFLCIGLEDEWGDALAAEGVCVSGGHGESTSEADLVGADGLGELFDADKYLHTAGADIDDVAAETIICICGEGCEQIETINGGGDNVDGGRYLSWATTKSVLVGNGSCKTVEVFEYFSESDET